MPAAIPEHLARLHAAVNGRAGRGWIAALPALIGHFSKLWPLQIGEPFLSGNVALVASAERHGRPVVLKINFVDEETRHEAIALRFWNGQSAVQVLETGESAGALLLERLDPGTPLARTRTVPKPFASRADSFATSGAPHRPGIPSLGRPTSRAPWDSTSLPGAKNSSS